MARSVYNIQLNCDPAAINQVITSYINADGFKLETKNNETYYKCGDGMLGYKYFNYSIYGNQLTIQAWIRNAFGELEVQPKGLMSINILVNSYRGSLDTLLSEINRVNAGVPLQQTAAVPTAVQPNAQPVIIGYDPNTGQPVYGQPQIPPQSQPVITGYDPNTGQPIYGQQTYQPQPTNVFETGANTRYEKMANAALIASIVGLLISFVGYYFGIIVYGYVIYAAIQGLKSKAPWKSYVAFGITAISTIIVISQIIAALS